MTWDGFHFWKFFIEIFALLEIGRGGLLLFGFAFESVYPLRVRR
jgi:hypothetical protein